MEPGQTEVAIFAAGCFWGVEHSFRQIEGVIDVTSGYTGGRTDHPTYKQVCYENTGHAEAVRVVFDPTVVTYEQLLDAFFSIHDPTTLNRQGPDIGDQYRSAIFFLSQKQAEAAKTAIQKWQPKFASAIVTEVTPASEFWPAEEYHQRYFEKNGISGCGLK
jgi:peptide-methionine (S)-S-oxide reductase